MDQARVWLFEAKLATATQHPALSVDVCSIVRSPSRVA